ncbi:glycosyltransferase [Oceanobacillus sp. 143]|uniref:Glycosyltransferase family 1 protein n=1 Tax=Oceanobacillus zhaokaii TaxID=2052660 RepID=A0A345PLA5_9BACI|nr:glycosyltransferase family 4 protein [Oceanobacillus zhaokaii]AXI10785.1 glycosyltransferase family 1 protein [Oceanobacillus zhaokaii]QGS69689.1 glycosyltransferase [Oceanobacillus sp. 143]
MADKILFCATVDYHFKAFHLPYMKWFKEQGWEVDVAASGNMDLPFTDNKYHIDIQRSPFHRSNIQAYKQLKKIIDQNNYSIIHCHTPLGSVLARLAARDARRKRTKVIYTAHGFHFCKGAPLFNWLIYYPIEKYLSRYTDTLITINEEDYQLSTKHRFKAGSIEHVHGVGVDTEKYKPVNETKKAEIKKSFGYQADDFLLFYAAEFNKNKNQQLLLQVMALIKNEMPSAKLLLAGEGSLMESCRLLAKELGISHMVDFLGFRKDIDQILPMCDVAVGSSYREGLPVNIMEAMACGLPVVAVDNRGHRELISNNSNGWIIPNLDVVEFAYRVMNLSKRNDIVKRIGINGRNTVIEKYSVDKILQENKRIYQSFTGKQEESIWAVQ